MFYKIKKSTKNKKMEVELTTTILDEKKEDASMKHLDSFMYGQIYDSLKPIETVEYDSEGFEWKIFTYKDGRVDRLRVERVVAKEDVVDDDGKEYTKYTWSNGKEELGPREIHGYEEIDEKLGRQIKPFQPVNKAIIQEAKARERARINPLNAGLNIPESESHRLGFCNDRFADAVMKYYIANHFQEDVERLARAEADVTDKLLRKMERQQFDAENGDVIRKRVRV